MNNNIDKDFIDENGEKATMHIENANGYRVNMFKNNNYKLANSTKKSGLLGIKNSFLNKDIGLKTRRLNLFTKDIGVKSSGFTQVASLSFLIALAGFIVMFILFRY